MRLSKKAKRSHLRFALGGIQKTKQFTLRATSRKRLSLRSAISHLVLAIDGDAPVTTISIRDSVFFSRSRK
jgi:hypothetical protein